jgi:hypothetical protein
MGHHARVPDECLGSAEAMPVPALASDLPVLLVPYGAVSPQRQHPFSVETRAKRRRMHTSSRRRGCAMEIGLRQWLS